MLLSGNWISIFSNSDHTLDHIHLGSNPKLRLDVSYPYTKFGVNKPKQTKVIEGKLNFYFKVTMTLIADTWVTIQSYPYTTFGVNRPKQTKVIEQKLNFYF